MNTLNAEQAAGRARCRLSGAQGGIGLVRSVSRRFCAAYSRIRLTADGKRKPCLHSPAEYGIRSLNPDGMAERFRKAIGGKPICRSELSARKRGGAGRNMNRIGG